MKVFCETERFLIRELSSVDAEGMFKLDSDYRVHTYLGKKPVQSMEEVEKVIEMVREQYIRNGIGRWAIEEKLTGNFIGWAGLKLIRTDEILPNSSREFPMSPPEDYYDLGYRICFDYWGKGIASECANASINYAKKMGLNKLYAAAHLENIASDKVLRKVGFIRNNRFYYDDLPCYWYSLDLKES